jgi:hypothetical protein
MKNISSLTGLVSMNIKKELLVLLNENAEISQYSLI